MAPVDPGATAPAGAALCRAMSIEGEDRRHNRAIVERFGRTPKDLPWRALDRARYPQAALDLAWDAARKLALGEYSAVHLFARMVSNMTLAGVPIDLLAMASRIPSDEIRHADFAMRFAAALSDAELGVGLNAGTAPAESAPVTLAGLDDSIIGVVAIGETLACALLGAAKDGARDPLARAMYASILSDEISHARFGWRYLAWRARSWSLAEQKHAADVAGEMVASIEMRFSVGRDAPRAARAAARALGVVDTPTQRGIVASIMEDEIVPALDALGLGASHAWRVRQRAVPLGTRSRA